VRQSDCQQRH